MKRIFLLAFTIAILLNATAQNVGVGTTIPAMPLHVSSATDTALLLLENRKAAGVDVNTGIYFKTGTRYYGAIKTIGLNNTDARLGLYTYSSIFPNNLHESMTILDNGNVGISNISPDALLDVNGTFHLRGNGAGAGKVLMSDATGNATWQNAPVSPTTNTAFSVLASAATNIAYSFSAVVPFNNKSNSFMFDDGNNFNTSTHGFVAPAAGTYTFSASVALGAGTAVSDGYVSFNVVVDGFSYNTPDCFLQTFAGKPLPPAGNITTILHLLAGQTVTVKVYNNSGGTISVSSATDTHFSGYRLY